MANYYFLATALPPLQLNMPPDIRYPDFLNLLHDNLNKEDLAKARAIHLFYDIQNIKAFWKGQELDFRGTFDSMQLEEALVSREGLPGYVYDFLDKYDETNRLRYFPELTAQFFKHEANKTNGFLHQCFQFERELRLVLTGFRAKQLKRDLAAELQFEDPNDDLVAQILAQKDSSTYIPPDRYQDLQILFEEYGDNPLELYKALCEYRFYKIEEILGVDLFSIDRILGYMAQLIIVEKWHELDQQKGLKALNTITHF